MQPKLLILLTVFLLLSVGCKRKENVETPLTRLVHKWLLVKSAVDDDLNGTIDPIEYKQVSGSLTTYYSFDADNTGDETVTPTGGSSLIYNFTWDLTGDTLNIVRVGRNSNNYYVKRLTNISMELILSTDRGPAGYMFEPR